MTDKTISYRRVSTVGQVTAAGDSLEAQRTRIEAWCTFQGLSSPVDFCDAGISGSTVDGRPAFKAAVRAALEAGEGTVFVALKLDRFGRDSLDVQETLALLMDSGIRVVAINDGIDSASTMGATILKLLVAILSSFADLERSTIRERVNGGRERAKAAGKLYASEAPYGKTAVGEKPNVMLVDNPEEQNVINHVRSLTNQGMSIRSIAARLSALGLMPRRGEHWSTAMIWRLTGKSTPAKIKTNARLSEARERFLRAV